MSDWFPFESLRFVGKWCTIFGTWMKIGHEWQTIKPRKCQYGSTDLRQAGNRVLEWLRSLDREDRRAIGLNLMRVQFGWPIGMPLVRSLKDGLWEVRSSLPSRKIARLILCFHRQTLVVLHGFIKKTQTTPAEELDLAKRRMKEVTK
ncbi:MAG: type II toxin-antitoxin system RelE/ParE family toxin [Acidobacteriaceae bacterium]